MMPAKTARNNAIGLAQIVRTGWYKSVQVKSTVISYKTRALLAIRSQLMRTRYDLVSQIRGVLRTLVSRLANGLVDSPGALRKSSMASSMPRRQSGLLWKH